MPTPPSDPSRGPTAATLRRLEHASGAIATQAIARMDDTLPWFRDLPAEQRSWVSLIAQAGVSSLVEWIRSPEFAPTVTGEVFGRAPRQLARAVSLRQTVELVRVSIAVLESQVDDLAAPGDVEVLRDAVVRFSREVAFAAAQVYAAAAETRGTWDTRLEALLVDALSRGDLDLDLTSQSAALGWADVESVTVVAGPTRPATPGHGSVHAELQRIARRDRIDILTGVHGARTLVVIGGSDEPMRVATTILSCFDAGPVVVGPTVGGLGQAAVSAAAAISGLRAAAAWPDAPRPVEAGRLLAERALAGDERAREELRATVYADLLAVGDDAVPTVAAYLDTGGNLEASARVLFVHPNTVRYRLGRVAKATGLSPTVPRDRFVLSIAIALGRLADATTKSAG